MLDFIDNFDPHCFAKFKNVYMHFRLDKFTQGSQIRLRHSILVLLYFGAWKRSQEFSVEADMT